ncbi:MAG: mechanosensitive ion channel family protein [Planctomycetota bacterium]|jgi:small conductance mechanosensitive channel|nr:mechanosensitive ion channel family protein [Planctomycetota bacterium]
MNPCAVLVYSAWASRLGASVVVLDEGGEKTHSRLESFGQAVMEWLMDPDRGLAFGVNVIVFILIMFAAKILGRVLGNVVGRALKAGKLSASELLIKFFVTSTRKVVFLIGLVMGLGQLGMDVGPLLAGVGVVGFVVGFALKDTLGNFAAGIMILLYRPYDVGDFVEVAGHTGKVDAMSLASTVMLTTDNQKLTIPNGSIWGGVIRNVTAQETRRIDLTFGIGYEDDINKAAAIIEDILAKHELVLKDPAPVVRLTELADSSVNFVCRPWTKTSDYWGVKCDVTKSVKERFDAEGISIPFPQRDVHLFKES